MARLLPSLVGTVVLEVSPLEGSTLTVLLLAGGAALASVVGGLLALWHKPTTFLMSVTLGFAGGVLLATITLDMIPRALELGSLAIAAVGFAIGFGVVYGFDLFVHRGAIAGELAEQREQVERHYRVSRPLGGEVTVLAGGTSIEEFIEGLAIGVGAALDPQLALLIAIAIIIDNLAEGLSIGEFIRREPATNPGEHLRGVLVWTGLIAVAILISALLGWFLLRGLPPSGLAFMFALAAGGLLYLTVTDLVPTAQAFHYQQSSAVATAGGFLVMLMLSALV